MKWQHMKEFGTAFLTFFVLLFFYQDCGVKRPGVYDPSSRSVGYIHTGKESNCSSCHLQSRPSASQPVPLNPMVPINESITRFYHMDSFGGLKDCVGCHAKNPLSIGKSWSDAIYNHLDGTGTLVASCRGCHESPLATPNTTPMIGKDHLQSDVTSKDCSQCHSNVGMTWLDSFSHIPTPSTCIQCHDSKRPSNNLAVPVVVTVPIDQSPSRFLHADKYGGLTGDCFNCHTDKTQLIGVTWINSGFYDHTDKNSVKITTCQECHEAPLATPNTVPSIVKNHADSDAINKDCSTCHSSPGVSWLGAGHTHNIQLDNGKCNNCHVGDRPAANTMVSNTPPKNYFTHSSQFIGSNTSLKDCSVCHLAVPGNLGIKWMGGNFNHLNPNSSALTTCLPCHSYGSDRPTGPVGNPPYDHAVSGMGDCISCHKTTTIGSSTPWRDGQMSHSPLPSTCNSCHNSARPLASTRYPTNATNTNNVYFHNSSFNGSADCALCHSAVPGNAGTTWAGGLYNHTSSGNTTVTTCLSCHSDARQLITNFSTTAIPSNLRDSFVHANNYVGNGECFGCHLSRTTNSKTSTAWNSGRWRRNNLTSTSHRDINGATVQTCLPCHSQRGHRQGQQCFQCHKNAGVNWNN